MPPSVTPKTKNSHQKKNWTREIVNPLATREAVSGLYTCWRRLRGAENLGTSSSCDHFPSFFPSFPLAQGQGPENRPQVCCGSSRLRGGLHEVPAYLPFPGSPSS